MEYRCSASPAFSREFLPASVCLPAVLSAAAVLFNREDSLHDEFLARHFGFAVDRYPKHHLPSPMALLEGVAVGLVYGLIPSAQAGLLVAAGRLVAVAAEEPALVDLYWHHWEVEPPLAREISQLIVDQARRHLVPCEPARSEKAKAA